MNSNFNLVASFSQNASQFAFQASISQKNTVDIYPLDASNNYEINSSLVNHLDYESHDLKASDVIFSGWCSQLTKQSTVQTGKRKLEDGEGNGSNKSNQENFFINAFEDGQVLVFSSTGKEIVNIIRNKDKIIAIDTVGSFIWTLDSDQCVKKLEYNKSKPLKTFHLIDGKDEETTHFEVLNYNGSKPDDVYLSLITEQHVYIIDPSKRRPATIAEFDVFGALSCAFSNDGKFLVIATIEKISVYDFESQSLVHTWKTQAGKIKVFDDLVFTLNMGGVLSVFKIGEDQVINSIRIAKSEVIDFVQIEENIMIAWLNVNEPNFKLLSFKSIIGNDEIIINEITEESEEATEKPESNANKDTESEKEVEKHAKKITKFQQNELNTRLIKALSKENEETEGESVIELLLSESWNEQRVASFITMLITTESLSSSLFNKIVEKLKDNIWIQNDSLHIWLKWLATLRNIPYSTMYDKIPKKNMKSLKMSLKASNETLPILLGMQGRLEMLSRQNKLREELAKLNVKNASENVDIENGEGTIGDDILNEDEEAITYVNGENDIFVDATEFASESELAQ